MDDPLLHNRWLNRLAGRGEAVNRLSLVRAWLSYRVWLLDIGEKPWRTMQSALVVIGLQLN
jgi:hypothetical protein